MSSAMTCALVLMEVAKAALHGLLTSKASELQKEVESWRTAQGELKRLDETLEHLTAELKVFLSYCSSLWSSLMTLADSQWSRLLTRSRLRNQNGPTRLALPQTAFNGSKQFKRCRLSFDVLLVSMQS